jgi:hypothetical protein
MSDKPDWEKGLRQWIGGTPYDRVGLVDESVEQTRWMGSEQGD